MAANMSSSSLFSTIIYETTSFIPESYSNLSDNSYSNYTTCAPVDMPFPSFLLTGLYALVCIVGLMGNTLVIYVVTRFSNMQTVTNMYILNLAIADECYLAAIPFLIYTAHMGDWIFGHMACKVYMVSTSITQFTSSIFLLIMSADRYIAICHHISSPKYRTPMVSRIVSLFAWIASGLIMLPIMMYANIVPKNNGGYSCNIIWPVVDDKSSGFSFIIYSLVLGFVIPLCFILIFYCLVIRKLRSMAKKTNKSKGKRRSHRKVTKLVLTVITVYVLCWLPYWLSQTALMISSASTGSTCSTMLEVIIFLFVGCLGYVNSAINPILYAYLSDNFKKSFVKACRCAAAKDVNAQLKMENSVLPKKSKDCRSAESQFTLKTRCSNMFNEITTATTLTAVSNVSSRNPSPPLPIELEPAKNENLLQLS